MSSRHRVLTAIAATVVLSATAVACGSGEDGGPAATTSPATTSPATTAPAPTTSSSPASTLPAPASTITAPAPAPSAAPAPGTVTLDVSGVTGASGLVMLAVIGRSVPNGMTAAACEMVGSDPFSFTGAYKPITGDDPCTLGSEPVQFEPGSYEVIVAVLQGGARSPEQCVRTDVMVDGDVMVEVTGLGPAADCNF